MSVILETSIGDITVDLLTEERPRCCLNFLKLCKIKYFNFSLFHSVQKNLVAQTGDPTGTGKGGESIFATLYGEQAKFFDMEVKPRLKHRMKGTMSMVNNGNGKHGSQFFLSLDENLDYLDEQQHTVFGQVAEGNDVLDKLNELYCDEDSRPYVDIRIYHTIILDDPYDDPAGLEIPDRSPEPTKDMLDTGRIRADEEINDTKGLAPGAIKEMFDEKEAKANAQILEMVGDLPDAEVKPPDTILFVCKLNPVTTSDDLEMIFSRFGEIKSCEVIKDQKSGESLQYAFIEFEKESECENAYFKMDNVLIDDRRIHVDFSQSVSKMDLKKGWDPKPTLKLKDRSKKQDGYDLVFDHDEGNANSKKKKKTSKKYKSSSGSSSDSDSDVKTYSKKSKKRRKDQSNSPQRQDSPLHLKTKERYRDDSDDRENDRRRNDRDSNRRGRESDSNRQRDRDDKRDRENDRINDRRDRGNERDDRRDREIDRSDRDYDQRDRESDRKNDRRDSDRRNDRDYDRKDRDGDRRNDRDYDRKDRDSDRRNDRDYNRKDRDGERRNDRDDKRDRECERRSDREYDRKDRGYDSGRRRDRSPEQQYKEKRNRDYNR